MANPARGAGATQRDLLTWHVLRAFTRSGGVTYGAQIAQATCLVPKAVSATLASLRASGAIRDQAVDGSAHLYALTDQGQVLAEDAARRLADITGT